MVYYTHEQFKTIRDKLLKKKKLKVLIVDGLEKVVPINFKEEKKKVRKKKK